MPSLFIPVTTMVKRKQINNSKKQYVSDITLFLIPEGNCAILLTQSFLP